ncbi:MAG: hypothetical protein AAFV53_00230 [Myxococcota bacterium]
MSRQTPDYVARFQRAQQRQQQILKEEGEALQQWAEERSPVRTGNFKGSWELSFTEQGFTLINTARDRRGGYGGFVRRVGEDETVQAEVTEELRRRSWQIAQRLQKNLIETMRGG